MNRFIFYLNRDNSGSISAREMKSVIKALGIEASDSEIHQLMKQMDVDGKAKHKMYINTTGIKVTYCNYSHGAKVYGHFSIRIKIDSFFILMLDINKLMDTSYYIHFTRFSQNQIILCRIIMLFTDHPVLLAKFCFLKSMTYHNYWSKFDFILTKPV